jgi:hypothetical protein
MQANSPGQQQYKTATGWRHWPVMEQFFELKRKVAIGEMSSLGIFAFAVVLFVSSSLIIAFGLKGLSDFAGIFVLYLATLMLALQPEGTPGEDDSSLRAKQKRHLRIALGFVVFGTMMQFSSFHLSRSEAKSEIERKLAIDQSISQIQKAAVLAENRLNELEKASAVKAQDLARAQSEIQKLKESAEHVRANASLGSSVTSRGTRSR